MLSPPRTACTPSLSHSSLNAHPKPDAIPETPGPWSPPSHTSRSSPELHCPQLPSSSYRALTQPPSDSPLRRVRTQHHNSLIRPEASAPDNGRCLLSP